MSRNYIPTIDEDIIRKAQQSDTEAFSKIYKAYYNKVYFIAFQYYRNEESAKDIVQEVFIRVHKKIDALKEPKAFASWLSRITYTTCVNYNRTKLKTVDLGETITVEDFIDNRHSSISDELEGKRVNEIIMESLQNMSIPMKSVGLLRYYDGLQIGEIANILDVPRGTVNSRISRIKVKLQEDLKRNGISPKNYSMVLAPATITLAYQTLSATIVLGSASANELLETIVHAKTLLKSGSLLKLALGGMATTVAVAGILMFNQPTTPVENDKVVAPVVSKPAKEVEEVASFLNVSHSEEWTNEAVNLTITTTNDNYDQILMNGIETTSVIENGTYTIQLINDEEIVDQREIEVSNIDIHSPNGSYEQHGDTFTYYLSDDVSKINPDSIRFYKNDQISEDYTYNEENNTLTIVSKGSTIDKFYISDYAGNELEIIIQ